MITFKLSFMHTPNFHVKHPCVQVRHQEQLREVRHQLELERQTAVRKEKDIAEAALEELEQTKQVRWENLYLYTIYLKVNFLNVLSRGVLL